MSQFRFICCGLKCEFQLHLNSVLYLLVLFLCFYFNVSYIGLALLSVHLRYSFPKTALQCMEMGKYLWEQVHLRVG